jgi:hypothetical protein
VLSYQKFVCTCAYNFWQVGRIPTFDFLQVCQFRPSTVFYGKQFMQSTTAKSIWMRLHHFWALNFLPLLRRQSKQLRGSKAFQPRGASRIVLLLSTDTTSRLDTQQKRGKKCSVFYSGHYQTYQINVQASCGHNCKFSFIGVAGPGVLGDQEAINQIPLGLLIENLPGLFCAIGDCAYTPTEHLVPIFRGDQAKYHQNDNFNFFASQLRIQIEMAFGLMVKKWGVIGRPLSVKLANVKHIVLAIARLHKKERLLQKSAATNQVVVFTPTNVAFDWHSTMLRDEAALEEFEEMASEFVNGTRCHNIDRMMQEIHALQLTRPGMEG